MKETVEEVRNRDELLKDLVSKIEFLYMLFLEFLIRKLVLCQVWRIVVFIEHFEAKAIDFLFFSDEYKTVTATLI